MPELPEVETIRLQLDSVLPGLNIKDIEILKPRSFIGEKRQVTGEKIKRVRRFAKILVIDLSNGLSLAVHLKMTGQLIYRGIKEPENLNITDPLLVKLPNKHTRVIIAFTSGDHLYFNDLRMFGWMKIIKNPKSKFQISNQIQNPKSIIQTIDDLIRNLGPEPLKDLTLNKFKKILKSSNKPVKLVLMDQEKLSGVGNIYANESLFCAGIRPTVESNTLSHGSIDSLFHCLGKVLKAGIRWGGASENNYLNAFGEKGHLQKHFRVYGRKGEKCFECGTIIKKIKLGGRGTFYCPSCQKL